MSHHRPHHRLAALFTTALLTVGLAACGSKESSSAKSPGGDDLADVTLRVGVQKDGIRAILEKTGQLKDVPYKIEFSTFQFGPPLVEAAGADKIDLAWVGSTPPLFGAAAGGNFKVIAAVQEDDHQENSLVVPKGSSIKGFEDLKGKKVAVPKGSSGNGYLFSALKRSGVDVKDVKIVFLPPADGLAAFSTGSVDAWVIWDPFVQLAEQTLGATAVAGGQPDEHGVGFEVASAKALANDGKRAAIADYLGRLQKAWAWARKNPDGWAEAWTKDTKLPIGVTKDAARAKASTIVPIDAEISGWQQTLADLLAEAKILDQPVQFKDIVDASVFTPSKG